MNALEQARMQTKYWEENRDVVIESGYFANRSISLRWFIKFVDVSWRHILGLGEDDDMIDALGITPTMIDVLHFFGKGVHRVGAVGTRCPVLLHFPPIYRRGDESIKVFRAVPKKAIAAIVGRGVSAVEEAIARFDARGQRDSQMLANRLAKPIAMESGICLDGIFSPQSSFGFMHEVEAYDHAEAVAQVNKLGHHTTGMKQIKWARDARRALRPQTEEQLAMPSAPVIVIRPEPLPTLDMPVVEEARS